MKKGICLIIFLALCAFGVAKAHDVYQNGTATMVIHFEPGDESIANKPLTLFFDLSNSDKNFSITKCDCTLNITEEGKIILASKLLPAKAGEEFDIQGVPFTFANAGNYSFAISAVPLADGTFTPFSIEGTEDIVPAGIQAQNNSHSHTHHAYPQFQLAVYLLFTIFMGYCLFAGNKPKQKKST
jgi:hypothetical protein